MRDLAVVARCALLEASRSPWTWTIVPIAAAFAWLLFGLRADPAAPATVWTAVAGGAEAGSSVIALWALAGILSREVSSGRADLLLSAGIAPRRLAWGLGLTWASFVVLGTWACGAILVLALARGTAVPGSVLLAVALAPADALVVFCLGTLLGALLPRRMNVLAVVVLLLAPSLLDRAVAACDMSIRPGRFLEKLVSPAGHLHAAPVAEGIIYYDTATADLLLALVIATTALSAAAFLFGKGRSRERLR